MQLPFQLESKLPSVGTTIFATMSAMANEYSAINLSQGYPDFPVAAGLTELVVQAVRDGHNQYAPMPGLLSLREAVAAKYAHDYSIEIDPGSEITIAAGGTQAIFNAISAFIGSGDEVIMFSPAYDCYGPSIELAGGTAIYVPMLAPDFQMDWQKVRDCVTERTRMIIINNPHNPTGRSFTKNDREALKDIVRDTSILVLSDEVYEHIVFDNQPHFTVLNDPELRERSIAVFSFGKTFHATGWKIGYSIAPKALTNEIRKVHQYVTFSVHHPSQWALAEWLKNPSSWTNISSLYQGKRDLFLEGLKETKFSYIPSSGSYFQAVGYENISDLGDVAFSEWLTKEVGVAAIPISVFYPNGLDQKVIRFCFAKKDDTLERALKLLQAL